VASVRGRSTRSLGVTCTFCSNHRNTHIDCSSALIRPHIHDVSGTNTQSTSRRLSWQALWLLALLLLGLYYLYRAVNYRFGVPGRIGPPNPIAPAWYYVHVLFALPVVLGAPLQFLSGLRSRMPALHRALGKAYVCGATVAALTAIYMGGAGPYEGSRLSIVITGILWAFFTLAAWRVAVARNFVAHRAFMIRSYTLALVLVWLRLMYDLQDYLFFYVRDEDLRDATREWASWVVPLLVVELYLSWVPQLRRRGAQ
jgi:uncharacterized membrane protein